MHIGWVIATLVAIGLGVLYYKDHQRVLALREKEAEASRKNAKAALIAARTDRMSAVTERAKLMRDPKAEEWISKAQGSTTTKECGVS